METGLAGQGIVVTGASGGIGAACARAFAEEGARVLVHYHRGEERARALADELGGAPVAQADLTVEADAERLFAEARDALGTVAVCAAVAGVYPSQDLPVWELDLARFQQTIAANLTATFLTARAFLRGLADERARRARPRRLDRGTLRRGGARGLCRREGCDPGRPAPLAEERGREARARGCG